MPAISEKVIHTVITSMEGKMSKHGEAKLMLLDQARDKKEFE
jgi:hypothetical protein